VAGWGGGVGAEPGDEGAAVGWRLCGAVRRRPRPRSGGASRRDRGRRVQPRSSRAALEVGLATSPSGRVPGSSGAVRGGTRGAESRGRRVPRRAGGCGEGLRRWTSPWRWWFPVKGAMGAGVEGVAGVARSVRRWPHRRTRSAAPRRSALRRYGIADGSSPGTPDGRSAPGERLHAAASCWIAGFRTSALRAACQPEAPDGQAPRCHQTVKEAFRGVRSSHRSGSRCRSYAFLLGDVRPPETGVQTSGDALRIAPGRIPRTFGRHRTR